MANCFAMGEQAHLVLVHELGFYSKEKIREGLWNRLGLAVTSCYNTSNMIELLRGPAVVPLRLEYIL